jgi:hypothetical protein
MRRFLSPALLALPLFVLTALPARADGGFHVFRGSHFRRFAHVRRFDTFHHFQRFGAAPFVAPFFWDWADEEGPPVIAGGGPGAVIVLNLARPATARPPPPARTMVETSHGVTVVRGPGSHHFAP